MKVKQVFIAVFSTLLILAACGPVQLNANTVQGSGNIITAEREVSGFSSVQVNLGADLELVQSSSESLSIEADDNLMDYITTEVQNGKLIVATPENTSLTPSNTIKLHLGFDTLNAVDILGSSAITADDLDLDSLAINFSGSGSTQLAGAVDQQTINIRGRATIHNFDLVSSTVTLDISGNGTVEVNAENNLQVTVAGNGDIHYLGNPTIVRNIMGTATIVQS
ncbi:MAG: DUF2807 domain-containing protein [Anaerolineae bacterium]|nr:DUF2807 domain-containing protein [Anaerolineae bacterium]